MRKDRMKTKEYSAGSTVLTVAFVLICLVWIMPIYEVVVNSLKSNNAINLDVFALPNYCFCWLNNRKKDRRPSSIIDGICI